MRPDLVASREFLDAAAQLVRRRTGLIFAEARRAAFEAALVRGLRRSTGGEADGYLARLELEPAVLDDLVAEITVGETYFFREPQQFAVIRDEVIPALLPPQGRDRPLRIWSAGCASGEEPFTLAIVLRELGLNGAANIVGTDLSRIALARARQAVYTPWSLRGVPEDVIRSHFVAVGEKFSLVPAVREAVDFRYLNLAEDAYPSLPTGIWGMDLILCRNVLIYFDKDTVVRVARGLLESLGDDGWLLLGSSDPMIGGLVPCDVEVTAAGLAYRRASAMRTGGNRPGSAAVSPEPVLEHQRVPETAETAPAPGADAREPDPPMEDPTEAARCYAVRDYRRAAEVATAVVRRDDGDPALWIVLVRSLANQGQLAAAGLACAAALDRHRTSAELAYLHAMLLAEAGRCSEAASAARRALYLDRRLVVAHLALGGALARLGEVEGARRALGNAERLLVSLPPDAILPASDGEPAGRLAEMTRVQLQLLRGEAA